MIIGTLPVVIPIFANLLYSHRDGKLAWSKMIPAGLHRRGAGVRQYRRAAPRHGRLQLMALRFGDRFSVHLGRMLGWYALRNARWLRENPDKHPMMWATARRWSRSPSR